MRIIGRLWVSGVARPVKNGRRVNEGSQKARLSYYPDLLLRQMQAIASRYWRIVAIRLFRSLARCSLFLFSAPLLLFNLLALALVLALRR